MKSNIESIQRMKFLITGLLLMYTDRMDYTKQTEQFWKNVNAIKKSKRLTWNDIADFSGHSASSLSTMSTMNKMPSLGFAMGIAAALDVPIQALWNSSDASYDDAAYAKIIAAERAVDYKSDSAEIEVTEDKLQTAKEVLSYLISKFEKEHK